MDLFCVCRAQHAKINIINVTSVPSVTSNVCRDENEKTCMREP